MSLRILVTGAAGLLGGESVRALTGPGRSVFGASRDGPGGGKSLIGCDLSNADAVKSMFDEVAPDVVVHAAGRISASANAIELFERDNVTATANVVNAARSRPVTHFIYTSSISVYSGEGPYTEESPVTATDPYGQSKRRGEQACLSAADATFRPVILRLGGLHGPPRHDGVVAEFFRRGHAGETIHVPEPKTTMTLTFIEDVIEVVDRILGVTAPAAPAIFNIATREAVELGELAAMIRALTGARSRVELEKSAKRRNRALDTGRIRAWLGLPSTPLSKHLARISQRP
jgi:nucleoside-diphosphate-sugar epimerase